MIFNNNILRTEDFVSKDWTVEQRVGNQVNTGIEKEAFMSEIEKQTEPKLSFEKALENLQLTVKKLESGDLTLEQALKSFEEGVRLARNCQDYLSVAERKVEVLTRISSGSGPETEPFKE